MEFEQRVRERAHAIWERAGRPDGQEQQHWQQALDEIEAERTAMAALSDPEDLPMPGERAALREGTLPGLYTAPQGDENRDPPPNAPAPVQPESPRVRRSMKA